jgi:hypothetical protein
MRIEKRGDGEYLIGAPEACDGCDETHAEGGPCCHHLNGEHLAVGWPKRDGACEILVRWPIEPAQTTPDPFALGIIDGLRRVESMLRDLEQRRGIGAERKLELLAESIAAEIADVNDAIANRLHVRGAS